MPVLTKEYAIAYAQARSDKKCGNSYIPNNAKCGGQVKKKKKKKRTRKRFEGGPGLREFGRNAAIATTVGAGIGVLAVEQQIRDVKKKQQAYADQHKAERERNEAKGAGRTDSWRSDKKCGKSYIPDNAKCGGKDKKSKGKKSKRRKPIPWKDRSLARKNIEARGLGLAVTTGYVAGGVARAAVFNRNQRKKQQAGAGHTGEPGVPRTRQAYDLLGVKPGANFKDVKSAFRQKSKETHPDLGPPEERDQREQAQKDLNTAYEYLEKKMNKDRADSGFDIDQYIHWYKSYRGW